jgi:hypothetical protein
MDIGHAVSISSRLILGAIAVFLAILLWSKTRDTPWMFMVGGMVTAYIEIIYSILNFYGFIYFKRVLIGSVPLIEIILPSLKMCFFITAFFVMAYRRCRK